MNINPEPCSAAYCEKATRYIRELEAALHKAMGLLDTSVIDVNDADIKLRKAPRRMPQSEMVTRFVVVAGGEANS